MGLLQFPYDVLRRPVDIVARHPGAVEILEEDPKKHR